jgi:hypothetical protein
MIVTEGSTVIVESTRDRVLEEREIGMVGLPVGKRELSVFTSTALRTSEVVKELEIASICAYKVSRMPGGASRWLRPR